VFQYIVLWLRVVDIGLNPQLLQFWLRGIFSVVYVFVCLLVGSFVVVVDDVAVVVGVDAAAAAAAAAAVFRGLVHTLCS